MENLMEFKLYPALLDYRLPVYLIMFVLTVLLRVVCFGLGLLQMDGKVVAEYNMGNKNLSIAERGTRKVNDRNYHVVKFTRAGPNSTLQLDNWDMVKKYPSGKRPISPFRRWLVNFCSHRDSILAGIRFLTFSVLLFPVYRVQTVRL